MSAESARNSRAARIATEFVVIFVGIVVALAADRWIAESDERANGEFYRQQLELDLRSDSVLLASRIAQAAVNSRVALEVLSHATGLANEAPDDPAMVAADIRMVGAFSPLDYNRASWDEMVSSGQVRLIGDPALRRSLATYYNNIENFTQTELEWDVALRALESHVTLSSDPIRHLVLWNAALQNVGGAMPADAEGDLSGEGPVDADFIALVEAVRQRPDFQQELAHARVIWSVAIQEYESQLDETTALLRQVMEDGR